MKTTFTFIGILFSLSLFAQKSIPNLSKITDKTIWKTHNRTTVAVVEENETVLYFDARQKDGLATFQNLEFENGVIELDIKGKDVFQRSFVGVAFHIQDNEIYNAIYFRPFNFRNPERSEHSVQYISHPEFTWNKLRGDFPGQFENSVNPFPNPEKFFHAKVVIKWPMVSVFVESAKEPSLKVKMKSEFKKGKIGLWVGNGSDGAFKNLVVKKE